MVDRGSFHPVPRIQFIGAQSPPVSTNRGLGDQFLTSLSYHNYGGVLHDHIPRVLRTRHRPWSHSRDLSTLGVMLFETLRTMNQVRPFRLVFLVAEPGPFWEVARQRVVEALDSATARGLLKFLDSPHTIRSARTHEQGWDH
jgi:hypothetical protein